MEFFIQWRFMEGVLNVNGDYYSTDYDMKRIQSEVLNWIGWEDSTMAMGGWGGGEKRIVFSKRNLGTSFLGSYLNNF
jgi:hypothetical protein